MKRFALLSSLSLALTFAVAGGGAAAAAPAPVDCEKLGTCEEEQLIREIRCLGNMDCPR